MNIRVVAPDTNVVLAHCYGPPIETRGPAATALFEHCLANSKRLVLLPSVELEVTAKLGVLNTVYQLLQQAQETAAKSASPAPTYQVLENSFLALQQYAPPRTSRIIEALTVGAMVTLEHIPEATVDVVLGSVLMQVADILETAQERLNVLSMERVVFEDVDTAEDDPNLKSLIGNDFVHVRGAASLSRREKAEVLLVSDDAKVRIRKNEIESKYPSVKVTSTLFARSYLDENG